MFKANENKEIIKSLSEENKRLRKENMFLLNRLDEIDKYKSEYEELIKQVKNTQRKYSHVVKDFDDIKNEYVKELEKHNMKLKI